MGKRLDFSGECGAGRRDRDPARLPVRVVRFPGSQNAGLVDRAPGRAAAARWRDRVPVSVRGVRVHRARDPGGAASRKCAVAAAGRGRHSARARLLDVRLLLSLHARRPGQARRRDAGGSAGTRRRSARDVGARHRAAAAPLTGRCGDADVPDGVGIVQRALHLRRRISRDDHADRGDEAERRLAARDGRDGGTRDRRGGGSPDPASHRR